MKRHELLMKIDEGDLIAIQDPNKEVHIVWRTDEDGRRICRTSMILSGTQRRDEREWDILGKCSDHTEYERKVEELGRRVCGHCLSFLPKGA